MRLTPDEAFRRSLSDLWETDFRGPVGVAVSGGGDSMAMLDIARKTLGIEFGLRVATVDHGLRDTAKAEIELVEAYCKAHGLHHDLLVWGHAGLTGNLQAKARAARYELLEDWAETHEIDLVLVGHTDDDRAETFIMNLARGSGVDGLTPMQDQFRNLFRRPLLDVCRADLRAYLQEHGIDWAEDPSNDDDAFQRVKVRKAMGVLGDLGLTGDRLLQTAEHMRQAKFVLKQAAADYVRAQVVQEGGDLLVPRSLFQGGLGDTDARVLSSALCWIGNRDYRPRYSALTEMARAVGFTSEVRTLSGVVLSSCDDGFVRLAREFKDVLSVEDITIEVEQPKGAYLWDGRWWVEHKKEKRRWWQSGPEPLHANLVIRALGEAIKDVPSWRDVGLPRSSLMATPAVFDGDTLIAAPIAGLQNGFEARIVADFPSFLLSR